MNKGHVLLHRALLDSQIFASQIGLKIWIWLLFKAAYNKRYVPVKIGRGETTVTLEIGELLFGRFKAEEALNIDGSTIYKWLGKMEEMGMIKIKSNTHYSIVTIENYATYQKLDNEEVTAIKQPSDSQVTTNQQPSDSQVTHIIPLNINKPLKHLKHKDLPPSDEVAQYPDFLKVETKALFDEYFKNRIKKKYSTTPRAKKILFKQLIDIAKGNDEYAQRMIEKSLLKGWGEFFPLKDSNNNIIEVEIVKVPEKQLTKEESTALIQRAKDEIKAKMNQGHSEPEKPINKKEATEGLMNFCDNFGR